MSIFISVARLGIKYQELEDFSSRKYSERSHNLFPVVYW